MSLSDDLLPPRRPLFFPVVIATVFLSIIGMSAGLVLGSHHKTPPERDVSAGSSLPTEPVITSVPCPPEMHATARRLGYNVTLVQVLRVRAASTGTTVWICRDEADRLYYQGNRGGYETWIEGKTALFLTGVVRKDDGFFAVAANGTTFFVSERRLEIVRKKGAAEGWDVTPE
ncbi:hypothetical protein ACFQFC_17490 [Amorphoplanes digitatis]|uniref:Uncharacterized protein n=1 Tax=Actinoplanes digitatis TaxID=1868 RepID=A0A7W7I4D0_9ACTN|nr:hypothetical protein [Actinoplanes digitatis]MBB4766008.1 hypothetical protein [Actinoplanes digitatis]